MNLLALSQSDPKRAEPLLEGIVLNRPKDLFAIRVLGLTKKNLGKLHEAVDYFKRALNLDPDEAETNNQLALVYRDLGQYHLAILHMMNAAEREPTAQYWTNLGKLFMEHHRLDSAEQALRKALALNPNFASAHYELSLLYGLQGEWSKFFPQYEWRLRYFDDLNPKIPIPLWDGGDIQGKRLLVYGEQGYGDWIQFARYLVPTQERGAYIVLYCPSALVNLLRPLAHEVVSEPLPPADFRCSVVSLPYLNTICS